jgi:hypothetical protein
MNIIKRNRKALGKVGITVETYTPGGNKTRNRIYKPSELHIQKSQSINLKVKQYLSIKNSFIWSNRQW